MQQVEFAVDRERVLRVAAMISSRHRQALKMRLDGVTLVEAGRKLKCSYGHIANMEKDVRAKIAELEKAAVRRGAAVASTRDTTSPGKVSGVERCRFCGREVVWMRPDAVWHKVDYDAMADTGTLRMKVDRYPHRCVPALKAMEIAP